jgi:hypothetical protein
MIEVSLRLSTVRRVGSQYGFGETDSRNSGQRRAAKTEAASQQEIADEYRSSLNPTGMIDSDREPTFGRRQLSYP